MKQEKKDFIKKIYLCAKKSNDVFLENSCNKFCKKYKYTTFTVYADVDDNVQDIYFVKYKEGEKTVLRIDVQEGTYCKNEKKSKKIIVESDKSGS